ncbi:MAG TPA: tetratricopeptide repeat protein [Burkholderiales bacterium]|nr:tetratricopeptide repeat protein [Burkholderiales bacterium]
MKALEKAAQDRKENNNESGPPSTVAAAGSGSGASKSELTLEPAAPPLRRAAPAAASPQETQQAATIIRAERRDSGGIGAIVRERPLAVVIVLAVIVAIGYGAYLYLQISNPRLFAGQSPPPVRAPAAIVATTPPASAGTVGTPSPPSSALTALPLLPLQNGAVPAPLAAKKEDKPAATAPETSAAPEAPAVPIAPRDTIKVSVGGAAPTLNPLTVDAYQALVSGDLATAQQRYDQLLKSDPANLDALLGLAAIASRQGDRETAAKRYLKALELDPRNAAAQAGLLNMFGGADPLAAETRLKELIASEPAPALYFTLGNVYADQQRWPDAQQAYFEAYHLQSDNPDYAYNLAVGLDHIGQPKLALEFYQRATQLARSGGRANFSITAAEDRIGKLQKAAQ